MFENRRELFVHRQDGKVNYYSLLEIFFLSITGGLEVRYTTAPEWNHVSVLGTYYVTLGCLGFTDYGLCRTFVEAYYTLLKISFMVTKPIFGSRSEKKSFWTLTT